MKFAILLLLLSTTGWAGWSVSTYNIRNFDDDRVAGKTDVVELEKILKDFQSDVMSFAEIVNVEAFRALVKKSFPVFEAVISDCGGFGKQRLAIVYNPRVFSYIKHSEDLSFSGNGNQCGSLRPLLLLTLRHLGTQAIYNFGVVHLKAGGDIRSMEQRWKQYKKLERLSGNFKNESLILLGDFNTTGYKDHDQDFTRFAELLAASSLHTTSESLHCTSYWDGGQGGAEHRPSTLDHIILQDRNLPRVESVRVGAHCAKEECRAATPTELGQTYLSVSDHCPVQVVFK